MSRFLPSLRVWILETSPFSLPNCTVGQLDTEFERHGRSQYSIGGQFPTPVGHLGVVPRLPSLTCASHHVMVDVEARLLLIVRKS